MIRPCVESAPRDRDGDYGAIANVRDDDDSNDARLDREELRRTSTVAHGPEFTGGTPPPQAALSTLIFAENGRNEPAPDADLPVRTESGVACGFPLAYECT
jgi:hypothetical protein